MIIHLFLFWACRSRSRQCDQTVCLFVSNLAVYNDENLPNNKNNCSRFVPNFFRYHRKCSWKRFPKTFAKVAKFFQSCSNYIKGTQKRLLGHYLQYIISVQKGSNQSAVDHQASETIFPNLKLRKN